MSADKVKKYQTLAAKYDAWANELPPNIEEEIPSTTHYTIMADLARMAVEDFKDELKFHITSITYSDEALSMLKNAQPHLDCVGIRGCKASVETK